LVPANASTSGVVHSTNILPSASLPVIPATGNEQLSNTNASATAQTEKPVGSPKKSLSRNSRARKKRRSERQLREEKAAQARTERLNALLIEPQIVVPEPAKLSPNQAVASPATLKNRDERIIDNQDPVAHTTFASVASTQQVSRDELVSDDKMARPTSESPNLVSVPLPKPVRYFAHQFMRSHWRSGTI
jgi:hypothetical protein